MTISEGQSMGGRQVIAPQPIERETLLERLRIGIQNRLAIVADDLFGDISKPEPGGFAPILIYLALAAFLSFLTVLRKTDILFNPQFFAEDGPIFFYQNLKMGFWQALLTLYNGFPYLLHRLVAAVATPFGIANAPRVYSSLTVAIGALASACFSLPHFRHIVRSDFLRCLFCVALVLSQPSLELVGVLTNIHWYLGIWAFVMSLIRLPRSHWGLALLLICYAICLLGSPIAYVAAPLWAFRALRALLVRDRREGFAALFILIFMVLVFLSFRNLGAQPDTHFSRRTFLNLVTTRVITQGVIGINATVLLGRKYGFGACYAVAGVVVGTLFGLSAVARLRGIWIILACTYGLLGSIFILVLGRASDWNPISIRFDTIYSTGGGRYFVFGMALLYLAFIAAIDRLRLGTLRVVAITSVLWVLVLTTVPTYQITPFADLNWQQYAALLSAKLASNDPAPLEIPINPPTWQIAVDLTLSSEVVVPAQATTGELVQGIELSQSFISQCASLAQIDLVMASYGRVNHQPIILRLYDEVTSQLVAEQLLEGTTVRYNIWYVFPLQNISDSIGKRYRISLTSPQSRPGDAITVWQSTSDSYAGGEAMLNGRPLNADLAFRYGCAQYVR